MQMHKMRPLLAKIWAPRGNGDAPQSQPWIRSGSGFYLEQTGWVQDECGCEGSSFQSLGRVRSSIYLWQQALQSASDNKPLIALSIWHTQRMNAFFFSGMLRWTTLSGVHSRQNEQKDCTTKTEDKSDQGAFYHHVCSFVLCLQELCPPALAFKEKMFARRACYS